MTVYPVLH